MKSLTVIPAIVGALLYIAIDITLWVIALQEDESPISAALIGSASGVLVAGVGIFGAWFSTWRTYRYSAKKDRDNRFFEERRLAYITVLRFVDRFTQVDETREDASTQRTTIIEDLERAAISVELLPLTDSSKFAGQLVRAVTNETGIESARAAFVGAARKELNTAEL